MTCRSYGAPRPSSCYSILMTTTRMTRPDCRYEIWQYQKHTGRLRTQVWTYCRRRQADADLRSYQRGAAYDTAFEIVDTKAGRRR